MKNIAIILIFSLFLYSCSYTDTVVLTDLWWEKSYNTDGVLEKVILKNGLKAFRIVKKYTVENKEESLIMLKLLNESERVQNIIITPALFSYIKEIESNEKNINYILLNGFYDDPADNVIAVYSSREADYYQAGVKAALFSKENANCSVASIFYDGSLRRRIEKENFIKGYDSVKDSGELLILEQQTYAGGEKLKNFISTAPGLGAGLYFFSASSLNPYCLELALPLSVPVSGENLTSLGNYNELVEFSVDDDMMKIINTAVKIGLDGEINSDIPVKSLIREKGIHF